MLTRTKLLALSLAAFLMASQAGYAAETAAESAQAAQPQEALQAAQAAFGNVTVLSLSSAPQDEIAFITPEDTERALQARLSALPQLEPQSVIRITDY